MADPADDPLHDWLSALERRHLSDLKFAEVRRGLQALSSTYVERRGGLTGGAALRGAGKRAAFAMFYGPLHYLVTRHVVRELGAAEPPPERIHDLGCGSGAAGAAWAVEAAGLPELVGLDIHPWASRETLWSWRQLGLSGRVRRGRAQEWRPTGQGSAVLAAYTVNELAPAERGPLLSSLLRAAARGARVLVIEPIAKRITPWWESWESSFLQAGGRTDRWRFPCELPEKLRELDRAAGLDHRELSARSLFVGDVYQTPVSGTGYPTR